MYTFSCHAHFFTHIHLRKLRTILIYIISPQLHFLQLRSKVCFTLCKHYSCKSKETLKLAHRYNSFQALSMWHKHPNSCSCYSYYCKHHFLWDSIYHPCFENMQGSSLYSGALEYMLFHLLVALPCLLPVVSPLRAGNVSSSKLLSRLLTQCLPL